MLVKIAMTKKVVTVKKNDSLCNVINKFKKYNISGVPVVEGKKVVGIVTEAEVMNAINAFGPKIHYDTHGSFAMILSILKCNSIESVKKSFEKIKVSDFMNKKVISIDSDRKVIEAAKIMSRKGCNRLPVIKNGKLIGIITRNDIIKVLGK